MNAAGLFLGKMQREKLTFPLLYYFIYMFKEENAQHYHLFSKYKGLLTVVYFYNWTLHPFQMASVTLHLLSGPMWTWNMHFSIPSLGE